MDKEVAALLNYGSIDQWPTKNGSPPKKTLPIDGFGFRVAAGSWVRWPGWDAAVATRTARIFRSPDTWDEMGRYSTVEVWQRTRHPKGWNSKEQKAQDLKQLCTPAKVPWAKGWGGPGGFTSDHDNGIFVDTAKDASEGWEILGMRLATLWDRFLIDLATKPGTCLEGDYVCDRLNQRQPDVPLPKGAQGPGWWRTGVVAPENFRGTPLNGPLRLVLYNVQFGPDATAADGGWVEHPKDEQPYGKVHPVLLPSGDDDRMVPGWTQYDFEIEDSAIEQWLDDERVFHAPLRETKREWAKMTRANGIHVTVSGTGTSHVVGVGEKNPADDAAWTAIGISTDTIARNLGARMFNYGTLTVH